jgi:hypothetical protein
VGYNRSALGQADKGDRIVFRNHRIQQTARIAAVALLVGALTSCSKDIEYDYTPSGVVAQVDAIRLTVGTQNVTVFKDGKVTLGPLSFVRPSVVVTATLLDAQGNALSGLNENEVRVNMGVESGGSGTQPTFTKINGFSGTLNATASAVGSSSFAVSLFDGAKHRIAFGPYYVRIVIR